MKGQIEKLFADWTVQQPPVPEFAKVKNAPSPGVFLAETKDVAQAFFTVGHLGGLRNDKDCAALEILARILGGGPQSRIAEHLRTKLGIPNDISATWNAGYGNPGLFEISGSTKSVSTVATLKAILEEIDRIRSAEVTEDEWRNARDAAVNNLVFTHDSRAKLFARQMMLDYYGYPKDFLPQYQKALQAVTRADVLRAAKQYLNPANLTVVVAANPAMFGESLEKLGAVTKLDLTIPEAKPEVIESTDASLAEGRQILLKAQAAAGGAEKLAAVKDYTMLAEYLIDPSVAKIGGGKIVQTDKWVGARPFPPGWHPSGWPRDRVHGRQSRLGQRPAGMGRADRRATQPGVGRSVPRLLPPAAQRPHRGPHGQRGGRFQRADHRYHRPGDQRGIRPANSSAQTRVLRHPAGGRRGHLLGRRFR